MLVLGISAYYHDAAAALVRDGVVVAAAQEERFTRRKHDPDFPVQAIAYCLAQAGVNLSTVDRVAYYEKPFLKFERLLETYLAFAPRGFRSFATSMPVWLKEKLFQRKMLVEALQAMDPNFDPKRLLFAEHHQAHAASAFYPSPFEQAAVLTLDGVGEWSTTSLGLGSGHKLEITREIHFPHSLGLLYAAFTAHAGFKVNSGEYKLMGLAPYGQPKYAQIILDRLIDLKPDGTFRLNLRYFDYCTGSHMTNRRFDALFGHKPRRREEPLTPRTMDMAASVQAVVEEAVLRLGRSIRAETGMNNLCLAGGVALNCVANGKLQREEVFDHLWIQPAAGDAGGALGAALAAYHNQLDLPRTVTPNGQDGMAGSYLGPAFTQPEIELRLRAAGARFALLDDEGLLAACAQGLSEGKVLGWHQGRMEFGPRALGNRSILADPRSPEMQKILNLKIKHRESFRPFAPSVLADQAKQWFDLDVPSPYMLLVGPVRDDKCRTLSAREKALTGRDRLAIPRSEIPAVTHVDGSARIQTVDGIANPRYHALLERFFAKTGCPVLVNTSFNVRGEPIVHTPEEAFACFMGTDLDLLAVGNCLLVKGEQDPGLTMDHAAGFELD